MESGCDKEQGRERGSETGGGIELSKGHNILAPEVALKIAVDEVVLVEVDVEVVVELDTDEGIVVELEVVVVDIVVVNLCSRADTIPSIAEVLPVPGGP